MSEETEPDELTWGPVTPPVVKPPAAPPTQVAMMARQGMRGSMAGIPIQKSEDFRGSVLRLWHRLRVEGFKVGGVVFLTVCSVVLLVLGPRVLGEATNVIVNGVQSPNGIDTDKLARTLLLALGLYVTSAVLGYSQAYILAGIVQRTMARLRTEVEEKLNRLPFRDVDRMPRGDLLSRVTNDIDNLAQSLQQTLSQMLTSLLTIVGVIIMMITISPLLAGIAIITIPTALFTLSFITRRSKRRFVAQWDHTGDLNAQIEEVFTGHELVKVFGRQRDVERLFDEKNEELFTASFGAQFFSGTIQPVMMFIGNLNYVAIAVIGGLRVASGTMNIGDVQAFLQYSRQYTQPLTQLASMTNLLQSGIASAERVFELIDAPEESKDPESPLTDEQPRRSRRVRPRALLVRPHRPTHRGSLVGRRAGTDHRDRRPHRCGEDHPRQPDPAVLRNRRRRDPSRWQRHRPHATSRPALEHRDGASGHVVVRRHHPRQHRVREPRRDRGGDPRGGAGDLRRPVRAHAVGGLRHGARRRDRQRERG